MELRKKKKARNPNDYPLFAFRVTKQSTKDELEREVERVTRLCNEARKPDEFKVRKNDVIVEALKLGLVQLRKSLKK